MLYIYGFYIQKISGLAFVNQFNPIWGVRKITSSWNMNNATIYQNIDFMSYTGSFLLTVF